MTESRRIGLLEYNFDHWTFNFHDYTRLHVLRASRRGFEARRKSRTATKQITYLRPKPEIARTKENRMTWTQSRVASTLGDRNRHAYDPNSSNPAQLFNPILQIWHFCDIHWYNLSDRSRPTFRECSFSNCFVSFRWAGAPAQARRAIRCRDRVQCRGRVTAYNGLSSLSHYVVDAL